jgi:hypothetical protein
MQPMYNKIPYSYSHHEHLQINRLHVRTLGWEQKSSGQSLIL